MASVAERNARLNALVTATQAWAAQRTQELQDRVASCQQILNGRTGSQQLAQASVQAASGLVIQQINDFLVGQ